MSWTLELISDSSVFVYLLMYLSFILQRYCQVLGGNLASIHSNQTQALLKRMGKISGSYKRTWIGAQDATQVTSPLFSRLFQSGASQESQSISCTQTQHHVSCRSDEFIILLKRTVCFLSRLLPQSSSSSSSQTSFTQNLNLHQVSALWRH